VHTYKVRWNEGQVNLSSVAGRLLIPFTLPVYAQRYHGAPTASADLICRRGRWWLHVVVALPAVPVPETGAAIGVDLGICRPAVTSDNRFLGQRHWREVDRRAFRLRRALQSNGSESAKRHLRRLAGRTLRFRRDCDHVLSKRVLTGVAPGTTVVVENLTNLRARVKARRGDARRRLHSWSFAQLRGFLTYKAEDQGCRVVGVDPRHTSQRCNRCGDISRGNRPQPALFACRACSHRANADANAARNIRDRYLVGWGKLPDRRAAVKRPIVGGVGASQQLSPTSRRSLGDGS
jgi:putative transposase